MPTPSKPAEILKLERKSHRTKKELAQRQQAETELLTGIKIRESKAVKENKKAHKEFQRVCKLLESIEKNDDLYGASINRYCLLSAECMEIQERQEQASKQMDELAENKGNMDSETYFKLQIDLQKNLLALDRQLQTKRKMLMDIEKENVMTIAASLRSIPKKASAKKSPLMEALTGD